MTPAELPVVYLDVDGVLWDVDPDAPAIVVDGEDWFRGADGVAEFMEWALAKCEVRWCTTWAVSGTMAPDRLEQLARYTGVPVETWREVRPGRGWRELKTENIAWEEHRAGRPFAWIEDGILPQEMRELDRRGYASSYVHTDVFDNPRALRDALVTLQARFGP